MELIHFGAKEFNINLFKKIENDWFKPKGGLWTSPINSNYGWSDWCKQNNFRSCDLRNSFTISLNDDAKILMIDSRNDLINLPIINKWVSYPDFELLAQEFDAIKLTIKGEAETRFTKPLSLYGWDCESVLILNSKCINHGKDTTKNRK